MAKKENTIPTIIDTPEALTAKIAAIKDHIISYILLPFSYCLCPYLRSMYAPVDRFYAVAFQKFVHL